MTLPWSVMVEYVRGGVVGVDGRVVRCREEVVGKVCNLADELIADNRGRDEMTGRRGERRERREATETTYRKSDNEEGQRHDVLPAD